MADEPDTNDPINAELIRLYNIRRRAEADLASARVALDTAIAASGRRAPVIQKLFGFSSTTSAQDIIDRATTGKRPRRAIARRKDATPDPVPAVAE